MPLLNFSILSPDEFANYIAETQFIREISVIQNHHTWKPSYNSLSETRNELYWLESMRRDHIQSRKWSDIGQNITIFPSGNIALCRPIDIVPAGIYKANTGAICIENFGNFDAGQDQMTNEQIDSIVLVNALLCIKFKLNPVKWQIVYHHWYDTNGKKFQEARINSGDTIGLQKSCPGTAFFNGNKISDAESHFFPIVKTKMEEIIKQKQNAIIPPRAKVNAHLLNVRSGPHKNNSILKTLKQGTELSIFASDPSGWSRIHNIQEEWVATNYLTKL
ncbi:MAG: N-acetylmuramoyl-L-alanine amidase [Saprospiraceae bacterium]|nr:N-acetylmuramoyl-L-alanine amidase [Saprospiraceae bacterium]